MKTYTHIFVVQDYIEHARLFGRLGTILTNCLYRNNLGLESVEVVMKEGQKVFKYNRNNTPDVCELLMQEKCRGEKIKISLITKNGLDEKEIEKIFKQLTNESFTEYYPNADPLKK